MSVDDLADKTWKAQRRWYHYDGEMVDFEGFLEKPMGKDIVKHHGGTDPTGQSVDEVLEKKFTQLMTEEEVAVRGDAYSLKEMADLSKPWELLTGMEKVEQVVVGFGKFVAIWAVLYMFIISLGIMGNAFKVLGGRQSGRTFRESELIGNPVAALAIGILATVLMQSSSTTTSIVISMASSDLVTIEDASFLVMGANIGTSVTNTIVSIAHLNSPEEYRRAFTGAVYHDMFNWLTVGIFLPLEVASGFLLHLAEAAVESTGITDDDESRAKVVFIKKITKPAAGRVTSVDKKLIERIAEAKTSAEVKKLEAGTIIKKKSGHVMRDMPMSDEEAGILLLFVSLTMLAVCLLMLVKLLQSVLKGRVAVWTRYILNLEFQHPCLKMCGGLDSYILLLFGTGCTILVQSSSVFTSTLTPLVGMGLIHIEKMMALTQGANIGTTVTGILAALSGDSVRKGLTVALEHVFFNSLGTFVWFVVWPLRPVPLGMAKFLGATAGNMAWFPLVYIVLGFFVFPVLLIALSIGGYAILAGVMIPFAVVIGVGSGWLYVRRNRADLLPAGFLRAEGAPCGCRYPNFMQLWGGDAVEDAVDLAEMREKEIVEKRQVGSVRAWDSSPMAWGLCITAFVGATLCLPTAQWRRVQYRNEARGRKEVGLGLWEMCGDVFTKDHDLMEAPPACTAAFIAGGCGKGLSDTCASDLGWATDSSAQGNEAGLYQDAWEECSKQGCRAHGWAEACPSIPGCDTHQNHAARCQEPLASYAWYQLKQAEAKECVELQWGAVDAASPTTTRSFAFNNHFYSEAVDLEEENATASSFTMATTGARGANAGDRLQGAALDQCTGEVTAVTEGGAAGARAWKFHLATSVQSRTATTRVAEVLADPVALAGEVGEVQLLDRDAGTLIGALGSELRVWDKDGNVLARYETEGTATGGDATRHAVLPGVFGLARTGRGIGALAVSPDSTRVLGCLSSAMTDSEALLEQSQVTRCFGLDLAGGYGNPVLLWQKAVLLSDAVAYDGRVSAGTPASQRDVRLVGASWIGEWKVALLENAGAMGAASVVLEADFASGTDLQGMAAFNDRAVDGTARATALALEYAGVDGTATRMNAIVTLVGDKSVRPVGTRKVLDLQDVTDAPTTAPSGVLVANAFTLVLTDGAAAVSGAGVTFAPFFTVQLPLELTAFEGESCQQPMVSTFAKGSTCRAIADVCPEGGLAGDMEVVAGLAITGTVLLGVGTVVLIVYTLMPWNPAMKYGHFISAGVLTVAWILLLAAWAHVYEMESNTYGCYLEDESLRGGLVLNLGRFDCITRKSYSWAFCIFAWGNLTLALGAVYHRVVTEVVWPHVPEDVDLLPVEAEPLH